MNLFPRWCDKGVCGGQKGKLKVKSKPIGKTRRHSLQEKERSISFNEQLGKHFKKVEKIVPDSDGDCTKKAK